MFEWHKPTKGGMGNCVTLKRAILKLLVRMVLAKDVGGPRTLAIEGAGPTRISHAIGCRGWQCDIFLKVQTLS